MRIAGLEKKDNGEKAGRKKHPEKGQIRFLKQSVNM